MVQSCTAAVKAAAHAKRQFQQKAEMGALDNHPYVLEVSVDKVPQETFKAKFDEMGRSNGGAVVDQITEPVDGRFFVRTTGQPNAVQAIFLSKNVTYLPRAKDAHEQAKARRGRVDEDALAKLTLEVLA